MRRIKFQKAVLRGPEYACSSCHRLLFKKSVTAVTQKLREKIRLASQERVNKLNEDRAKAEATFSELNSNKSKLKKRLKKTFESAIDAYEAWNAHLINSVDNITFLCSTCKGPLQKGNMPAMAVANGLELNHHDRPILTELESDLIAHNINFQKMVLLQKSCWAAGKGRMISIPVQPADIMKTVKQLPRLPNEAEGGLIPIKLKRKKEYKTAEKQEHIRPGMIFKALKYLNKAGHPYYDFFDDEDKYKARCKIKELRLLYGEEVEDDIEEDLEKLEGMEQENTEIADEAVKDSDEEDNDIGEDDMEEALEAEEEDIQNDPVRRQHFNYSEYSTLVNGAPEIFLDEEGKQIANLDFAPGEGKKPKNPSDQKDWIIRSWPTLLPDGQFGLDQKRRVKLTRQNYFQQRILNVDDRFANTKSFVFAAMSVVEAERLRSNANLSGIKGRRMTGPDGVIRMELGDPCSVFERIKGTPKYFQRLRYEMIARLENVGPFHIFFTLSCGDMRWSANFTPVLEKLGCTMHYEMDPEGREEVTVEVKAGNKTVRIPWKKYIEDHLDKSQHELIRRNVLLATRNFQHRVETFRREVIFGRNNPLKVRHISYRVEFQGRGAGHIHGVLWLDLKEMKIKEVKNSDLQDGYNRLRHNLPLKTEQLTAMENFTDAFVTCTRCVSVAGLQLLGPDAGEEAIKRAGEEAVKKAEDLNWHGHSKSCTKGSGPQCRWKFPRYPLQRTIFVDVNREKDEEDYEMKAEERDDILNRVMGVLVEEGEGGRLVLSRKVKEIMVSYKNVKETTMEQELDDDPPFSELNSSIFTDNLPPPQQTGSKTTFSELNLSKPKSNKRKKASKSADADEPRAKKKKKTRKSTITYIKMESPEEYQKNIRERIDKVLKIASAGRKRPITYMEYEMAVIQQPRKGSEVLLRRDIDEIFINNYNAEWIDIWDANLDVSPVYDYYGTITYITDYFTKDSTGLTDVLKTAVKQLSDDMDMREKCNRLADQFMTHRQVGEMEVLYKLFANMNLAYSSVATIFVPTEPKSQRRQFLQRQDPDSGQGFKVEDREGLFMEKPDLISKYERRKLVTVQEDDPDTEEAEALDQMCLCQYVKMFESRGWQQKGRTNEEGEVEAPQEEDVPEEGELAEDDDFNFLITGDTECRRRRLPDVLTLEDPLPGEPKFLQKRTFPRAIRFFKNKFDMDPHRYYLRELMLYHPFRDENQLFPNDPEKCEELYLRHFDEIKVVKGQLMPFLESVEEAQLIYEEMKAQEKQDVQDKMGADLDPENEQDIADLDDEDYDEEHPDFYHIDTMEENPESDRRSRQVFKAVALPSKPAQVILNYSCHHLSNILFFINILSGRRGSSPGHEAEAGSLHCLALRQKTAHLFCSYPKL